MAVFLSPVGGVAAQFFTNTGAVLTGGKLYTYAAGTTTPAATYTSAAGATFNTNPIVLDAAGRVPGSGEIWLGEGVQYKFVLKDSNDVLIGTYDNVTGINSNFVNYNVLEEIQVATAGQTVFNLTNSYQPGTNTLSVFVDGVNQYDGSSYSYTETNSTRVTFTQGLHVGALVKFTTATTLSAGVVSSNLVTYQPAGTNAVATTVQTQLRRTVFVDNFRSVSDTDDTVAFQKAFASLGTAPGTVNMTAGTTYIISGTVSCYAGQNLVGYGAILNVSNSNTVFLSYNVADTFNFINYYPPTLIAGFKVLGKVGLTLGTINPNFVLAKINRTPYVNMRDINLYYASAAWVLGESILCSFTNVNCYNPISNSFAFVLGSGGFGPNACTLFNCEIEEQKYPCIGVFISSGGINIDTCYLESLSTLVYLNGGSAVINNTGLGLRFQTGSTAVQVDSAGSLSVLNSTITFGGKLSTPISQIGLNINAATLLEFNGNIVTAIHDSTDTSTCFSLKALVKGTINDNQFLRNSSGTSMTLFACGTGSSQFFLGTFSDNYLYADAGSTIIFNASTGTGSYVSALATNNFMLRVTNFAQITGSNFLNNYYPASDKPPLPAISAASTITVDSPMVSVSGATAISTINASFNQITLVPTGAWATNTSGNIALGSTAVVGKALILTYDATTLKWYPSY